LVRKEKERMTLEESLFGNLDGCHVDDDIGVGGDAAANQDDDFESYKRYIDKKKKAREAEVLASKGCCQTLNW
jgi:hypothetical protein